ncbi:MAG: EAL domain-containing protein, partial [Pseudomonadota bacterium]
DRLISPRIKGENRWWNVSGKPVYRADKFNGFRGVISDVTEARIADARIAYLAHYDALTDLPNRAKFNETLERCLYRQQTTQKGFCMLTVDLDFFKLVNDEHGHDVGDRTLRRAADIMKNHVGDRGLVARTGGDEFSILLTDFSSRREVMALCDALLEDLDEPVEVAGHVLKIGASIGGAFCPDDADTASNLLKFSDLALYRAKTEGRANACYFEAAMDVEAQARRQLEQDLRHALRDGQFVLRYQPLIDTVTGKLKSCEALLRWQHPKRGLVSPDEFINLTEQTGMIVGIGEWVIRTAMIEAASWDSDAGISINLSPRQVKHKGIVSIVAQALAISGIAPGRVEFEITETVLLDDSDDSMSSLRDLKSLGVRIALDDFGTGYSSLTYLTMFPFDKIKIDKSFVQSMDESNECRAIVKAVTGLAASLGIHSTAEGVETRDQVDTLMADGCSELQGYYFSQPITPSQLVDRGFVGKRASPSADGDDTPVSPESMVQKRSQGLT